MIKTKRKITALILAAAVISGAMVFGGCSKSSFDTGVEKSSGTSDKTDNAAKIQDTQKQEETKKEDTSKSETDTETEKKEEKDYSEVFSVEMPDGWSRIEDQQSKITPLFAANSSSAEDATAIFNIGVQTGASEEDLTDEKLNDLFKKIMPDATAADGSELGDGEPVEAGGRTGLKWNIAYTSGEQQVVGFMILLRAGDNTALYRISALGVDGNFEPNEEAFNQLVNSLKVSD